MWSDDTDPRAREVQIALLRRATAAQRFHLVRSLSQSVIELSRRAVRRSMPGASERDVLLRWVELEYGGLLAHELRQELERRER